MRPVLMIAVCGLACVLCACQPRADHERPQPADGATRTRDGVSVVLPASAESAHSSAAVAVDASNQTAAASVTYAAPPSAMAPVRLTSMDERSGGATRESVAGARKTSARVAVQDRDAQAQRAIARYGGEDTSPGAQRAARGPVLMDAAKVAPPATAPPAD